MIGTGSRYKMIHVPFIEWVYAFHDMNARDANPCVGEIVRLCTAIAALLNRLLSSVIQKWRNNRSTMKENMVYALGKIDFCDHQF